jgi:tetratricopeptide (TPR) repeat protein
MAENAPSTPAPDDGTVPHTPAADPGRTVAAPTPPPPDAEFAARAAFPPELADRYDPVRVLGQGGMGLVFLVEDRLLGRRVALKEMSAAGPEAAAAFVREARITGRLQHPGVVPVYDFIPLPDGRAFYTMKPLAGGTLKAAADAFHAAVPPRPAEARPFRDLLRAFVAVARTAHHAHRCGVVHRDIKGPNVQVEEPGTAVVLDWGVAAELGPDGVAPGAVCGTPLYMSPEQARGEPVGPPSDVYALGALLYELLTGAPPVAGKGTFEIVTNVIAGRITPPRERSAWVPAALEAVCLKALRTEPPARYASADALADDVQRYLDDEPVAAHRPPLGERLGRWARRHRALVRTAIAAGALALVATAAVAVVVYLNGIQLDGERRAAVQAADAARAAGLVAQQRADEARAARAQADRSADEARAAEALAARRADEAQAALRASVRAVDDSLVRLGGPEFKLLPGLQPVQKELLERAAAGCDALLALAPNDPAVLAEVGKVRLHLAEVAVDIDGEEHAVAVLTAARAFQERRVAVAPADLDARFDLAATHFLLAVRRSRTNDLKATSDSLRAALTAYEALAADPRVTADRPQHLRCRARLGLTHIQIGQWARAAGRAETEVFAALSAGLDHLSAAYDADPADGEFVFLLAQGLIDTGQIARGYKRLDLARREFATVRRVLSAAPAEVAARPKVRQLLGNAYNLGHLVELADEHVEEAINLLIQSVDIRMKLHRENPAVVSYKADLASALINMGGLWAKAKRPADAASNFEQAVILLDVVVGVNPRLPAYVQARVTAGLNWCDVLAAEKRWEAAAQAVHQTRPYLTAAADFANAGARLCRCAAALPAPADRERRLAADAAVECFREAKKRGDKRTGDELKKTAPLDALRGAKGYAELLAEWGIAAPKP